MKFKYVVANEYNSDKFDSWHCQTKVKALHDFEIFLHLLQYKLSGPITQLLQAMKLILSVYISFYLPDNIIQIL